MRRVACEVQADGTLKLFLSRNPKCLNPRGTKYNLPAPKVSHVMNVFPHACYFAKVRVHMSGSALR